VIAFEDFTIDPDRFELRRGALPIRVEPKVLDLIVFLADNADRVVTRDELLGAVWKGVRVGDAALSRAIREARRALGDDGNGQRSIKTVRGRGYRFVAPIRRSTVAAATPPTPSARPGDRSFFGREEVLAQFSRLLDRTVTGRGTALVVRGEPGIGKSEILERCLEIARARGTMVAVGRCGSSHGAPAFWPWVQAMRCCRDALGLRAREVVPADVQLVLEPLWSTPSRAADYDEESARFDVLDATSRFFEAIAQLGPVAIAIDDIHAADTGSRMMADWLVRELRPHPVLLALSARIHEGRGVPPAISSAADLDLLLEGLTPTAVAAWLADAIPDGVTASDVTRVCATTRGNPLYIRHLLSTTMPKSLDSGPMPQRLREAIEQHLATIPGAERDLLEVAAVTGDTFCPADLALGLGEPIDVVLPRLERGLSRHWLQRSAEDAGRYELAHGMVRAVLYDAIPPERRAVLHERMGLSLVTDGSSSVEIIAYHLTRGSAAVRTKLGIDRAVAAARETFHKCAFDRTVRHCHAALEAMSLSGGEHPLRSEVLMLLASALGRDGDLEGAAQTFRRLSPASARRAMPSEGALATEDRFIVRESFSLIAPRMRSLVRATYARLFATRPDLRGLFHRNQPRVQELMLAETLTSVIDHLEDRPWLDSMLRQLGRGHLYYGVTEEMFEWLGDALLASLAEELGPRWTPPIADAWGRAYRSISETMMAGMIE
jgi:DNA-binding winged helix-turn-helix (wHTH) protein/hemoglobin-like flavoprotein